MSVDDHRWDPSEPGFLLAVLRTLLFFCLLTLAVIFAVSSTAGIGAAVGCAMAIALYVIALQGGRTFRRTQHYAKTMGWLLLPQFLLWMGMAWALAVVKIHPIGFVIGVSNLPLAIVLTLAWYVIRKRVG